MGVAADVYLVNAGNDPINSAGIANDGAFPQLAIVSLGTYLKQAISGLEVCVRDGQLHRVSSGQDDLLPERIKQDIDTYKPKIVGISTLSTSYQTALAIARYAKSKGATVVLGNDHARDLSREILKNRPEVDFVIGHEYGEKPLEMLVRALLEGKQDYANIPTLTYRDANGKPAGFDFTDPEHRTLLSVASKLGGYGYPRIGGLDAFPLPDRSLYPKEDLDQVLKNYEAKFRKLHKDDITGVVTVNNARGCNRFAHPCSFCNLGLDISSRSAGGFWQDISRAHEQTGANVFYEVCDSFTTFHHTLIPQLLKTKLDFDFEPQLFVYGQAADLVARPHLAQELKELGVFRLNIGLEAMADRTLQYMKGTKHGDSVETNLKALQLAKQAGLHVYGSFVLGSQMETPQTLLQTVTAVKRLIDKGYITDVEAQAILPLPGNKEWELLLSRPDLMRHIESYRGNTDWPYNVDEISRVYIDNFSGVSFEQVVEAAKEIRDHARKAGINFGSGFGSAEKFN